MNLIRNIGVGFLISLTLLSTAFAAVFPDVPENHKHFAAIEYLQSKGIVEGYEDKKFRAEGLINRAEATRIAADAKQFLDKAEDIPIENLKDVPFTDVLRSDWFFPDISRNYELENIHGYADNEFKPGNNINFAESFKLIFSIFDTEIATTINSDPFIDVSKDFWYAPFAAKAKEKQFIFALGDGKLHAEREITRGEFAEIVYRLMYTQEANIEKFPLSQNWPVFTHDTDHFLIKYPFEWTKIEADDQTIFWKQDIENGQVSFARIFPNSATVITVIDGNELGLNLDEYLDNLEYDKNAVIEKLTLNNYPFASVYIEETGVRDFYFELPNKTILIVYSQTGDGVLKEQLQEEIRYITGSIRYTEESVVENRDKILTEIRKYLLVKGQGLNPLNFFDDEIIIETDTIGIGTGPIDYYYSKTFDVTLKHERNSNTLLAMKDEKTSAF